ncbi:matrix-binding protein, partial [Streptococcus oralis subsp. oralis]
MDSRTDLTDEEKAVAKADAKAKADEAKKNIDAATTNAEVDQAKSTGTTEVNAVSPTAQSKPAAKQAIDDALKAKESAIDSRTDLTDEEKAAAKADAKAKADTAKQAIDTATTTAEVDQAKSTGTTEVNAVNPTAQSKPAAKQAIEDALKTKEAAIDSRTDLTDEEKAAAKADAKAKADEAKKNIDAATTNAEVDQAKSTGITEVNGVNPQPVAKPAAKQAIDDALKTKESAIDSRTDLTDEEKAVAKADAKAKADEAKKNIDAATTDEAVSRAKTDGITEVNGVEPTAQSKPAAKQAIDDALKVKEAAIDSRTDLTDEEKTAAKADAKAKADEAKRNIDTATTDDAVSQAKTAGTTEVNAVNPTAQSKPAAKQAIDDALKAKEAAIDSRTDLTDEEKAVAKADAKAKADTAKQAIDNATTNAEVDQAKSTGTTEVNGVNPQPVAKPAAKQAIDDALKAKESAIDSRTDLTDEEKAVAKADAKAKADTAKQAIDTATTNSEVDQAKNDGTTEVNSVNPTAQSKPAAKQAIDDALKAKEAAIDSRTDLTDEEKTAAKADAKAKADTAKQAIDAATTNVEVDQAKTDGITSIASVNPTAQSKPAAKQAIDDALKAKEAAIDSRTDLTDEEKAVAKADAKAKADEAKKNIDTATTDEAVSQSKTVGTTEVNAVNPTAQSKPAAKQA